MSLSDRVRVSVLAVATVLLLFPMIATAENLDACELDLDRVSEHLDSCEYEEEERSASWIRLGYAPGGAGLLQNGSLLGQLQLTPGTANEVRIAKIQPTQPAVLVSTEEAWATAIPDEWIDVVLVRQGSADTYALSVVRWVSQGLSMSSTVLATSTSFTQTGALDLAVGWSFAAGQVTVNFTGPASTTLNVQYSTFGSSLPWLSLPHFPSGNAEVAAVSLQSLSGSAY
ncbi:MAG: hypothetical protein MUE46_20725 [Xanthomonadales bacterium]|nr:hypothetical protein [Xanthomonadales bacterium]